MGEISRQVDRNSNNAPRRGKAQLAFCRHSLEGLSGAANIAGAVDVGGGEVLAGQRIMCMDSQGTGKRMFSITPAAKCQVGCTNLGGNRRVARIKFRSAFRRDERLFPFTATAINPRFEGSRHGVVWLELN